MPDLNKTITKKQQANLENAKRWLRRAKMDFNAFKRMVPFDKKTHRTTRCTDPALAIYLLQQSLEKATKSVAAATGKYSYSRLRRHRHNSLSVLLGFYQEILNTVTERSELSAFGIGFGLNLNEGLDKIMNLIVEVEKTPTSEQLAMATNAQIDKILNLLLLLRGNAFIGIPKSIFGPHGKIVIDGQKLNKNTPRDFVSSAFEELGKQLNIPQLSDNHLKFLEDIVKLYAPGGIIDEGNEKNIVIERPTVTRPSFRDCHFQAYLVHYLSSPGRA